MTKGEQAHPFDQEIDWTVIPCHEQACLQYRPLPPSSSLPIALCVRCGWLEEEHAKKRTN